MTSTSERPYDIVLFGATGFVGELTAEYLAEHAAAGTRWALAGRSRTKLEAARARLAARRPDLVDLPLVVADTADAAPVRAMVESTRVLATTVGPYLEYGEPVVAACAAAGTDYADITGEAEFIDEMWLAHHREAEASGARIVHCCGFDSIPYDLGALWTVSHLADDVPIALQGFGRLGGAPSGGSFQTLTRMMSRTKQAAAAADRRSAQEPDAASTGRAASLVAGRPHRAELGGGWAVPVPTIDPQIVLRSARALDAYGPDFTYSHYIVGGSLLATVGMGALFGTIAALAHLRPTRSLLQRLRPGGQGPSEEQRAKAFFRVRMVARTPGAELVTEITGGDPGCDETAKMLAQSALCLAFDDLPTTRGQVTPAVAMGQPLIDRLTAAGIVFRVV